MAAKNATSAARARKLEKQAQALELRRAGYGYTTIAARIGVSKTQAHRYVTEALEDAVAQVDGEAGALKAEEVSRLDGMLAALWPRARKGELHAIDRVLRIGERRAQLLGLDAPKRAELTGRGGGPVQSVAMTSDEFRAMAAEIAQRV